MVRNYHRKTTPVNRDALQTAIDSVRQGQMSQREAARTYGIAKTTLHDHLKDVNLPAMISQGRFKPTFTPEQEEQLVQYIVQMSERSVNNFVQ